MGTRDSELAKIQAQLVMDSIRRFNPDLQTEMVAMKTTGDRILDKPLDRIGGKGLFVKELDDALAADRVDLCVHSYKDMPLPDNPDLPVIAVTAREDHRDVLLLPKGKAHEDRDIPIGSSSQRRRLQLAEMYPDWECAPVRGNILTRIRKLDAGEYGALVLAAAGIKRLGLWDRVSRVFPVEALLPAACQGILAIQGRAGEDHRYLQPLNNLDSWDASLAERSFIQTLNGGCTSPVAAFAQVHEDELSLTALYVNIAGKMSTGSLSGKRQDAGQIGRLLATKLTKGI